MKYTLIAVIAFACAACGSHGSDGPGNNCSGDSCPYTSIPAPANGVAMFTVMPTAPVPGLSLTPLGSLNPPGHTLPTDHVYLYSWDLSVRGAQVQQGTRNVYMPATGNLFFNLLQSTTDGESKLMFRATDNFYFYFDHIIPTVPMTIGSTYTAGQLIGTTEVASTLDFGAFDGTVTHDGFLVPDRYGFATEHYVSPWKYFSPAMQPAIYAQMYRSPTVSDKDGKIDFSVAGELVGDWFLQGMPVDSTMTPYGWPRTLTFVYDFYDPSQVRIAIGGTIGQAGVWAIDSTAPRPENVTTANGIVTYPLINPFDGGPPVGYLLVQMTADAQIKIELFMGASTKPAQFDANAFTFIR